MRRAYGAASFRRTPFVTLASDLARTVIGYTGGMCGRFTREYTWQEVHEFLSFLASVPAWNAPASYNVAPTQSSLIAWFDPAQGGRVAAPARWGLIPGWAKDASIGAKAFNARAETVAEKPMFRAAYAKRRCIVPVSAFYEWRKPDRQPFAIALAGSAIMPLAGLWESWRPPAGEPVTSFTILTTDASSAMRPLHDRMPVILPPADWTAWLGETASSAIALHQILRPYAGELRIWPVGKAVGNVRNDSAALIEPGS